MSAQDTIIAVSTAPGTGAIGILRLSGSQALPIFGRMWQGEVSVPDFLPRQVYLGKVVSLKEGVPLDQVLTFLMNAPHSYTGEDLIEIQAHGGQRLLELILENAIAAGARLAEPGEFTRRAFLNGRMDLTQAEAVVDLIQATSSKTIELAARQLQGRLSEYVGRLRKELIVMRAQMEAMIDFPEDEDVQALHYREIEERIRTIQEKIRSLLETYEEGRSFREGVRVAIVGKPNVGKSSLFNALLKEERAIVHPTPGTTRDLIEEIIDLQGLPVRFIDTAGMREGLDVIELEGIRRTRERLKQTDLILLVVDSSRPLDIEDERIFETIIQWQGKPLFCIYNKTDLPPAFTREALQDRLGTTVLFPLVARDGSGLEPLKKKILASFVKDRKDPSDGDLILTNLRHRTALQKGWDILERTRLASEEEKSLELLATDLRMATDTLGEVTGEVTNDQILGEIFSKFCIGK